MAPEFSTQPSGFALVVVLVVIAMLTLLGTVSIDTTVVDLEIARSHRELRESFYLAEAAAMEGIQRLLNIPAIDRAECILYWHHDLATLAQADLDFSDRESWRIADSQYPNAYQSELDQHAYMVAAEERVAGGSSLIATQSRLYVNRIYGLCTKYNTDNLVLVGYYMRY